VVGGTRGDDFQLARLTPTGALDPLFDDDGWAQDFDPQLTSFSVLLVQLDGKIVACVDKCTNRVMNWPADTMALFFEDRMPELS